MDTDNLNECATAVTTHNTTDVTQVCAGCTEVKDVLENPSWCTSLNLIL